MSKKFKYIQYVNFSAAHDALVGGAAGGALGLIGGAMYNNSIVNSRMTPEDREKIAKAARRFNDSYDQAKKAGALGFNNKEHPAQQEFLKANEAFVAADREPYDKYSTPEENRRNVGIGTVAGGVLGAGLGVGLGIGAKWLANKPKNPIPLSDLVVH